MTCPVCGAENEAASVFCYRCGSRISSAPATGPTVNLSSRQTPAYGSEAVPSETPGAPEPINVPPSYSVPAPPTYTAPSPPSYTANAYSVPSSPVSQQNNNAVISMALGVLSIVLFFMLFCVGVPPLASAAAIPAVVVGRNARREIRASNGRLGGDGLALAGIITGWVTIAMSILAILLFVIGIIGLFALGATSN